MNTMHEESLHPKASFKYLFNIMHSKNTQRNVDAQLRIFLYYFKNEA